MKKVLKADFDYFQKCCEKWVDFFGLKTWCISYIWEDQDDILSDPAQAWVQADYINHMATVYFNRYWTDDESFYTKQNLDFIAFHEICEVMLYRLFDLATERFGVTEDELLQARHEICHVLENAIFKNFK
jgi:hypothetical protein